MTTKCQCGNDMEDWQTMCRQCYAKNGKKASFGNKDKEIKRQVFLKVASEQLTKASPSDLIGYAKQLETEFNKWA